jgi:ABC-type uncharacterized transport system ATPase subunit
MAVMRHGHVVATLDTAGLKVTDVIGLMLGETVSE